jgi:hypothetical protein
MPGKAHPRNRINNALKEIELLIPQEFIEARNAKEAAESGGTLSALLIRFRRPCSASL